FRLPCVLVIDGAARGGHRGQARASRGPRPSVQARPAPAGNRTRYSSRGRVPPRFESLASSVRRSVCRGSLALCSTVPIVPVAWSSAQAHRGCFLNALWFVQSRFRFPVSSPPTLEASRGCRG